MQTPGRRRERLADQLKRKISETVLQEVYDPSIGFVTITGVELSGDLQDARVFFSVLGDEERVEEARRGLVRAQRFLERTIFRELRLKRPVHLRFLPDETLQRAARLEELMRAAKTTDDTEETE
jgi:ribosome-binding factor A